MEKEPSGGRGETPDLSDPHFRAVFDDPHVLMALLEPDGRIRRVNRTAVALVTPDEEEIVGTPFWEGPWWKHSRTVQSDLRRRVRRAATGEYVEFEEEYYTGDDEKRLTEGILRPVEDDGDIVSVIASGRDVTDDVYRRQRMDVLQRILRHNVRNSLNVIQGYAEEIVARLENAAKSRKHSEATAMARTVAEQAAMLDESVAKVRQLERRDDELTERVPVETVFAQVSAEVRERYPDCTVHSVVSRGDVEVPRACTMALVEAVTNAVKHHPDSAPTVELTATVDDGVTPPQVRLSVQDDGPGIPSAEADPVLSGTETDLAHPSGVGLWLIKWIAERHGGGLSITSTDRGGSRVTLTIPTPVGRQ